MSTLLLFALGYCAAVIFPVPWVSRAILDGWAKLLTKLKEVRAKYNS